LILSTSNDKEKTPKILEERTIFNFIVKLN
jgi:hypothetical protein